MQGISDARLRSYACEEPLVGFQHRTRIDKRSRDRHTAKDPSVLLLIKLRSIANKFNTQCSLHSRHTLAVKRKHTHLSREA